MDPLLLAGVLVAVFVGYNIGGATTGVSFGPAVGARVIGAATAGILMSIAFFIGGWLVGPEVVETLGEDLVGSGTLTLETGIVVLFFIGIGLLFGNLFGVPASTSMTAVGAIAGLGLATQTLEWGTMRQILAWWVVAPVLAFWICGVIGRYFYPYIVRRIAIPSREDHLFTIRGRLPPRIHFDTDVDRRELTGSAVIVLIGCYMAFSSGASNVANAVAPLVGSGAVSMELGVIVAGVAVTIGAFTIARRTLETMASELTALPLPASLVVMTVSASIVTALSAIGIPVQLVIVSTMAIIGLGWGRATRTVTVGDIRRGERPQVATGALRADAPGDLLPEMGEEEPDELPRTSDLFNPNTTARVILLQNFVPLLATIGSYVTFRLFVF